MRSDRKYHYDEQQGVYVFEDEITVNWLLSQVLNKPNLQITKITNEELQSFLSLLSKSDLRLPDGQHSLFWLKDQLKQKLLMSDSKLGETWHKTTTRYRFIIQQIDHILVASKNIKKDEIEQKQVKKDENNIEAHFEPI